MGKSSGGLGFPKQPFPQTLGFALARLIGEPDGFDSDFTADLGVTSAIHDAHGAPPQLAEDFISADLIHEEGIVPPKKLT